MTCHLCRTLGGLRISFRGQAIPCDCPAGDKWREANRQEAATDAMLGLVPADHSIVEPHQQHGRTVLTGGTPQ